MQLKDPVTGEPTVEDILTRKELLKKLSAMIPNLKSRKEKPKGPADPMALPPGYVAHPMMPGMPGMPGQAVKAPEASQGSSKKKGKKKDK